MDDTVEMLEYRLVSKRSTVGNVESVEDENTDIIEFYMPDKIMFSKKKSYKAHVSVGTTSKVLRPEISVFDAGAGPNLIRTSLLPPECRQEFRSIAGICYRSAIDDHITVCDTLMLLVHFGDLPERV